VYHGYGLSYSVVGGEGQLYGPVDVETLQQWCRDERIHRKTRLLNDRNHSVHACDVPELNSVFEELEAIPSRIVHVKASGSIERPIHAPRNRFIAGLMALLLGEFGLHRFYLGYNRVGLVMLSITVLTCGFGLVITVPWSLFEAVLLFLGRMRDAEGEYLD
jgi:TM2 domain-containing membrane protein YozV